MTYKDKREAKEYQKKLDEFDANEAANKKGIWKEIEELFFMIAACGILFLGYKLVDWLYSFDNLFAGIIGTILGVFLIAWCFLLISLFDKREDTLDSSYFRPRKRKPIKQKIKDQVWNRDGGRCVYCGSNKNIEYDHIVPWSKGGADTYRNLQLLCETCNRSKGADI